MRVYLCGIFSLDGVLLDEGGIRCFGLVLGLRTVVWYGYIQDDEMFVPLVVSRLFVINLLENIQSLKTTHQ